MNSSAQFNTAYLAGYLADKYDIDAEAGVPRVNQRIKQSADDTFRQTVTGYTSVTTQKSSVKTTKGTVKYALFPAWLLQTTWKDKNFLFAMNGQSGKFVGNLPVDWSKFFAFFASFAVMLTLLLNGLAAFVMANSDDFNGWTPEVGLGCLLAGIIIALVIVMVMKSAHKTVKKQRTATNYIRQGSFNLRKKTDSFLYRNVSRTARPKANNTNVRRR
jgi:hypothetical protein